jgi:hypothetical protein
VTAARWSLALAGIFGYSFGIRGSVSHTARKLVGGGGPASSTALMWGEKGGDEAMEDEGVAPCARAKAMIVLGPWRVDIREPFLGVDTASIAMTGAPSRFGVVYGRPRSGSQTFCGRRARRTRPLGTAWCAGR